MDDNMSQALRRIQLIQFEILKSVDKVCTEKKIKYFLGYGTLLGAIRHKGFIPWDTDIDLMMLREDYEKFVREYPKYHHEKFYMGEDRVVKDAPEAFVRIYLKNSYLSTSMSTYTGKHNGIFIDIFPMDYTSDNPSILKLRGKLIRFLCNIKIFKAGMRSSKRYINILAGLIAFFIPLNLLKSLIRFICVSKIKKDFVTNYFTPYGCDKETVPASIFREAILVDFENNKFPVPINWEQWLKNLYGNYMEFPPIEKRKEPLKNYIIKYESLDIDFSDITT